ncbi:MAG TPA: lactate dehydrogenase [Methanomicrobiales archaeon]|jgi:malate dehydrogenase|nr:lactate dehydrogenase [Methanomicrobiales archaeon]
MSTLAVIGVGRIGGELGFVAALRGMVDELILYDVNLPLLQAQVLDIRDCDLGITVTTDTAGIRDADICIYAAGISRSPAVKTRADLLGINLPIAETCLPLLRGFSGVFVTVANPVDLLNFYFAQKAGIPRERVIGFGGQLDSARFGRVLRSSGIAGQAFVLGEHGEHQVPLFHPLKTRVDTETREKILASLRGASMEIIKGKGGTIFGPAWHISLLISAILSGENRPVPCSCVLDGEYGLSGCSLGVPARIGKEGIRKIEEWSLDSWEEMHLGEAAAFLADLSRGIHG